MTSTSDTADSRASLWRHPEFLRLWSAYTISRLGSQITLLALPLTAVFVLGAGATETGLLVTARLASSIFPGLLLGVWVDRQKRLPTMIAANVGSAVVIGSIPVAAALGALSMPQLYVAAYLAGVFGAATDNARQAAMPALIGRDLLVTANARMQVSGAVTQIAGPSIGGVLVQALTAPVAMAFDAVSFVVSAVILATIRRVEAAPVREEGRRIWHDITEGLRFIRGQDILFRSSIAIALANIEWFAVQGVLVVYATDELHLSPAALGLSLAAVGPATLIGAATAGPLAGRIGLGPLMVLALGLEMVSRLLLPFAAGNEIVAASVLGATQAMVGFTEAYWFIGSRTLQQSVTPDRLLGRVGAASFFIQGAVAPAALIAGIVADAVGLRPTLFAAGIIAAIAFVYLVVSPIRGLRVAPALAQS